jgi:tetratricopeptide (TPR) repeat protein
MTPADAMQNAFAAFNGGNWATAEQLCRSALAVDAGSPALLSLLGVITAQTNRLEESVALFERLVAAYPDDPFANINLGNSLSSLKRLERALDCYARAIRHKPDFAEAYFSRGNALRDLGRLDEALASFDNALRLRPDYAEAGNNRGIVLHDRGRFEAALASYDHVLSMRPEYAEAYYNRGIALRELGRAEQSLDSFQQALAIDPAHAAAAVNRGAVLHDLGRYVDALAGFEHALSITPDHAEAHAGRALALNALRRFDAALESCERALSIKPDFAEAYNHRGVTFYDTACFDDALDSFERALCLKPDFWDAHLNEAQCRLTLGQFAAGWEKYRYRWRAGPAARALGIARHQSLPGYSETNRPDTGALLIWGEAGIGDRILFSSMLEGARVLSLQIVVETDARLVTLLQRAHPGIVFVPPMDTAEITARFPAVCSQLAIGDLGGYLRRSPQDFPRRTAYLTADPLRAASIRRNNRIDPAVPVIGLSWRSMNPAFGGEKSLTLPDLLPLMDVFENAVFVSLQYGQVEAEIAGFAAGTNRKIVSPGKVDLYGSMEDLAAAISICDLVITCSNVTAHMACALGKPTKVLLPKSSTGCIWYWGSGENTTPWYPSARLFRQHAMGAWAGVVEDLRQALLVEAREPPISPYSGQGVSGGPDAGT